MKLEEFLEEGRERIARNAAGSIRREDYAREVLPFEAVSRCFQDTSKAPRLSCTEGSYNFKGQLKTDDLVKCQRCGSSNVFTGEYDYDFALVRHSEAVDSPDNYSTRTYRFSTCLDCLDFKETMKEEK